jgi:hypothetical protein
MTQGKPIHELVADDLRDHPLWTYATDAESDHDETWVRPLPASTIPRASDDIVHAACDIVAANGRRFIGFLSCFDGRIQDDEPIIVCEDTGYWPMGHAPHRRERAAFEAFFGGEYTTLFPLRWTMRVLFEGESAPRHGVFASG